MGNKLTDKERAVLGAFNEPKSPYSFWDGGITTEESGTYFSVFTEEIVGHVLDNSTLQGSKMVVNSLVKKGYMTTSAMDNEGEADHWIELTDQGVEMIHELGLDDDDLALTLAEDEDEPNSAYQERLMEQRKAAKEDAKDPGKPSLRTSHADCSHASSGKEGKIARAKCRRDRAAAAKKEREAADA